MANVQFTFDRKKALATIAYLGTKRIDDLSKGKICKLIFLADKHHLVRHGRPITGDRICAMKDGPVPSHILDILNSFLNDPGTAEELSQALSVDTSYTNPRFKTRVFNLGEYLSESDIESIDAVVHKYGRRTFSELRAITHELTAYKNAWEDENRVTNNPDMSFEELFEDDDDAKMGAYEEMIETAAMRQAFGEVF